jgi:hypothetical protein
VFVGGNSASFERTVVLMNDLNCRMVVRGISSFSVDAQYRVVELRDTFDALQTGTMLEACAFPFASHDNTSNTDTETTNNNNNNDSDEQKTKKQANVISSRDEL